MRESFRQEQRRRNGLATTVPSLEQQVTDSGRPEPEPLLVTITVDSGPALRALRRATAALDHLGRCPHDLPTTMCADCQAEAQRKAALATTEET